MLEIVSLLTETAVLLDLAFGPKPEELIPEAKTQDSIWRTSIQHSVVNNNSFKRQLTTFLFASAY
jgi:hypothetical protein